MSQNEMAIAGAAPNRLTKKLIKLLLPFGFGVLFIIWIVVPLAYSILWSLVDPSVGWSYPDVLPSSLSVDNWIYIIENANIGGAVFNSFLIAACSTLLSFLLAMPTSYALGRRPIRGKEAIKTAILLPMILPGMALAIYIGRVIYSLGLSGTYLGVILAHTLIGIPYMLRILVVGFESMPQDILDAASNLGAGPRTRLKEVYLPMLAPSIISGAIFTFINSMEEFTMSFIIGAPDIRTIPTVLFSYLGEGFSQTRASVVSLILLIPNLVLLMIVERNIKTEYMGAALGKM